MSANIVRAEAYTVSAGMAVPPLPLLERTSAQSMPLLAVMPRLPMVSAAVKYHAFVLLVSLVEPGYVVALCQAMVALLPTFKHHTQH